MSLSDQWELMLLQHIFKRGGANDNSAGGGLPISPTALWVSLHTADPTDVHTTAQSNELSGNAYARSPSPSGIATDVNITTHTNWNSVGTVGLAQSFTNKVDIAFPAATGNWNSGLTIGFLGLWTIASAGAAVNYLGGGTITTPVTVLSGNTLKFLGGTPGNLAFTVA